MCAVAVVTLAEWPAEPVLARTLATLAAAVATAQLRGPAMTALLVKRDMVLTLLAVTRLAQEARVAAEDHTAHW